MLLIFLQNVSILQSKLKNGDAKVVKGFLLRNFTSWNLESIYYNKQLIIFDVYQNTDLDCSFTLFGFDCANFEYINAAKACAELSHFCLTAYSLSLTPVLLCISGPRQSLEE